MRSKRQRWGDEWQAAYLCFNVERDCAYICPYGKMHIKQKASNDLWKLQALGEGALSSGGTEEMIWKWHLVAILRRLLSALYSQGNIFFKNGSDENKKPGWI